MEHVITLTDTVEFAPANKTAEILQNIRTLLKTRVGTVPLHRDFGLAWDQIDAPYQVSKSLMQGEIIDAIERYEPRAQVRSVSFDEGEMDAMEGILKPRVIVSIGEK